MCVLLHWQTRGKEKHVQNSNLSLHSPMFYVQVPWELSPRPDNHSQDYFGPAVTAEHVYPTKKFFKGQKLNPALLWWIAWPCRKNNLDSLVWRF